jgi:hypothetical protein
MSVMLLFRLFVALASSYNVDEQDFDQRRTSVESSLILDLPSHLIIPAASIKLNEAIGEGMIIIIGPVFQCYRSHRNLMNHHLGEFGVVFKGYIIKFRHHDGQEAFDEYLAIKTLKGWNNNYYVNSQVPTMNVCLSLLFS